MNNTLQDVSSGKCLNPVHIYDNAEIKLIYNCNDPNAIFIFNENHSIKHFKSGKCLQYNTGSPRPSEKTRIVLLNGCEENHQKFYVENGEYACIDTLSIRPVHKYF